MSGARDGSDMLNLHRNKRSITLNLKAPEGLSIFRRLVKRADIVVENFRPDVKQRLGIAYEDLKPINKRIILASISGFGETGPYRTRAGFDQIAQGMGGLMGVTGNPDQGPMRAGMAVADTSAGLYAAIGILVALAEREQSGEGQWVRSSLLQAQIAVMDFQAARYLVEGVVPDQTGNDHPYSTPMGVVRTADGFINIAVGGQGQWKSFCAAIGQPEMQNHPRYANQDQRLRHRKQLSEDLARIFVTRSSADWLQALEQAGVPAGPIYKMNEVFDDPQVQHLGMAVPVVMKSGERRALVGQGVDLSRTPPRIKHLLPDAGADNEVILKMLGLDEQEIERLRRDSVI
jgi:crotonobetainyl-CoA:carnitine CoA-transferase CaiB-like acyl-CoA transferase